MGWKLSVGSLVKEEERPEATSAQPFQGIAPYYDALMWDIDYEGWMEYTLRLCEKFSVIPRKVLDLACGTGACSIILADKGYEVIGMDGSLEMLEVARKKAQDRGLGIEFLRADMREFSLEGEVDLVICIFDSINYILEEKELERCFRSVCSALSSGGLFVFDMNTDYGLSAFWSGTTAVRDEKGVLSIWRNSYNSGTRIARLDLTLFAKEGELYRRVNEVHLERAYSYDQLRNLLKVAGFDRAYIYHHLTFSKPSRTTKRVMVVGRKGRDKP